MLSKKLTLIRKQNKLNQEQLARVLGVTPSAYCGYEIGRRKPEFDAIVKISQFYGVPLEYFIDDAENGAVSNTDDYEYEGEPKLLSQLTKQERDIIVTMRTVDSEKREEIIKLIAEKNK